MSLRGIQFWLLIACSTAAALLMIKQALLARQIIHEERFVIDQRRATENDEAYQNTWRVIASVVWKASGTDPALAELLKSENITVRQKAAPAVDGLPATNAVPPPMTPAPIKPAAHSTTP